MFGIETQREFADLLGYEQATISRFESGLRLSAEAIERIRTLALSRGIEWDDKWLFETPDIPDEDGSTPRRRSKGTGAVAA